MIPPVGSILIGPCSQCGDFMTLFCGKALPLEKEIMVEGSLEERRDHLLEAITGFLGDWLNKILSSPPPGTSEADQGMEDLAEEEFEGEDSEQETAEETPELGPIGEGELGEFVNNDLVLLDDKAYFDSVFHSNQ